MAPIRVHSLISELGVGGAESLLVDLAAAAPAVELELSVSYLQAGESQAAAARLREVGIDAVLLPFRGLVKRADHRAVRAHIAAVRPDIVHTHLRTADLVGGLAARALHVPQVCTLHGFDWDIGVSELGGPRGRAGTALVMLARRRLARRVIAPSSALERGWLEHTGDAPEHVVTIHSGSARTARPGAGRAVRAELGLADDDFVVAMVSRLHPLKRHALALEAAGRLAERMPRLRLLIVGDGSEEERLRRDAARLAPATVFTGYRDDVMELLDAADLLLHPSRMEGFPISLLEAMAAGVPIVATPVGGITDIVEDGVTGWMAEPESVEAVASAVAALHDDAALRARLAVAARRRFEERFTAERWANRLRALYEGEITRGPPMPLPGPDGRRPWRGGGSRAPGSPAPR